MKKRALSVNEFLRLQIKRYEFSRLFNDAFGSPQQGGIWFIWGNSGNGKTRFTVQLAKEMARFGKVLYNSLEEGLAATMQAAFTDCNLKEVSHKILLASESIEALEKRLDKQRSPDIVIVDSLQYAQINFTRYKKLKEKYTNKLLIFTSHADGKLPRGNIATSVMYDASLKIWVEGYKAFSKGRYFGTSASYTIWEDGAMQYWN